LFGVRDNVKAARGQRRLWKLAGELVRGCGGSREASAGAPASPAGLRNAHAFRRIHAGMFNQSLMELGRRVCTPQNPKCVQCPVSACCVALERNEAGRLPNVGRRPKSRLVRRRALLIWRDGRVLVRRRPAGGLLGGFWEFPGGELEGVRCRIGPRVVVVRHGVMHDRMIVEAFSCEWRGGRPQGQGRGARWRWATAADLRRLLFIGAHRKIINSACNQPAAAGVMP
jgi:A/G-specific adenine glycosylase